MYLVSMFHSKIKNPYEKVNIYSLCHLRNVDRFLLGFIKSGIKDRRDEQLSVHYSRRVEYSCYRSVLLARELPGGADNNESNLYIVTMCDFNTDIAILRAGVSTSIGRLNTSFTQVLGMSISSGNITMVLLEKQMKLL